MADVPAEISRDAGEILPEDLPEDISGDFPDNIHPDLKNIFVSFLIFIFYSYYTSL
ncbi:MAG: hypothetical protein AB3K77_12275 [Methanosarcinaceae archaeon]